MGRNHVASDKISRVHTTLIDAAVPLITQVVKCDEVRRVTPGVIESGLDVLRNFSASVKISRAEV